MEQKVIAVIDDDPAMLDMIGTLLTDEGYQVLRWQEAKPAYDLVRQHHPDLVILDLRMEHPQAGWFVIYMLRRDPQTAHIPVVLCTGDQQYVRTREQVLREQRVTIVVKPFDVDALLAIVAQLLTGDQAEAVTVQRALSRGADHGNRNNILTQMRDAITWFKGRLSRK